MAVLHGCGKKEMFLHQKRGPNVSVILLCRSCAAARGQVTPVGLAGLFRGKQTWVIYRFSRVPPAAESAFMILSSVLQVGRGRCLLALSHVLF